MYSSTLILHKRASSRITCLHGLSRAHDGRIRPQGTRSYVQDVRDCRAGAVELAKRTAITVLSLMDEVLGMEDEERRLKVESIENVVQLVSPYGLQSRTRSCRSAAGAGSMALLTPCKDYGSGLETVQTHDKADCYPCNPVEQKARPILVSFVRPWKCIGH